MEISTIDSLLFILDAIWDEVEIQEYPRAALLRLPAIILHPVCVRLSRIHPGINPTLLAKLKALNDLAQNRIYVFSSLAEAWRKAIRVAPEASLDMPLTDFLLSFAQTPPTAKVEFDLEAIMATKLSVLAPTRSYESYYGKTQAYAYACVLDLLNTMPQTTPYTTIAFDLLDRLLIPWRKQKSPPPVFSAWKSTTQLQVMLLLTERCLSQSPTAQTSPYLDIFLDILAVELLPRYRALLEWIVVRFLYHLPDRRKDILEAQSKMDPSNPKHTISSIKIAIMVASLPDTAEDYGIELAPQLMLLAASPKVVIRHEAQWAFPHLWDLAERKGWESLLVSPVYGRMNAYIRGLETYKNPPAGRLTEYFDLVNDHNLTTLVEGAYMDIEPRETPKLSRGDFLAVWKDAESDPLLRWAPKNEPLMPLGPAKPPSKRTPTAPETAQARTQPTTGLPLQTKGQNATSSSLLHLLPSLHLNHDPNNPPPRPTPLILIASLIANPHNLGGLSRVSEILGASAMHIASPPATTTSSREFTSVSVSSHLHLPIHQLPVSEIAAFLAAKKAEGYEVVGVEQTDRSRILGEEEGEGGAVFAGDGKTVLVLGSEREGIPGELLAEMDWCVEVRQAGVTRSMNVQTAAAVVLFDYVRQSNVREKASLKA